MQRAKTFFYVTFGIVALAGAFHLGAQTAESQGAEQFVGIEIANTGLGFGLVWAVDASGVIYAGGCPGSPFIPVGSLPPSCRPTSMLRDESGIPGIFIACANGDIYTFGAGEYPNVTPMLRCNIYGAPVQAAETSWGRVKAERR